LPVESCVAACQAQGFFLACVEFGMECCEPIHRTNGANCNMGCQGNPNEICGGPALLDLYNFTGTCPVGASVVPSVNTWVSQGCYSDSTSSRTLERRVDAGNVTVESCAEECQSQSFTIAGLEYAQQCWCGDEVISPGVPISQSACNQACVVDNTEVCQMHCSSTRPKHFVLFLPLFTFFCE
ncbi:WSC domain-containing protein, partial [Russula compacta]